MEEAVEAGAGNSNEFGYASFMKLGFEETQSSYASGSQSARAWTEAWVKAWAYCPHCGNAKISSFPNNSPLADFFCPTCNEEFELKSQRSQFGSRVADGAYRSMCERLESQNNPNLMLLNYNLGSGVNNLFVVPKHFFVRDIIEQRSPFQTQRAEQAGSGATSCYRRSPRLERYS